MADLPLSNVLHALQPEEDGWFELRISNEIREQIIAALELQQCGPNDALEKANRLVELFKAAWLETRQRELRDTHGMKIEQARIHASSELTGHLIRFEFDEEQRHHATGDRHE